MLFLFSCHFSFSQAPHLVIQNGHSARITKVIFAKNHPIVASFSDDNSVILWNIFTGRKILSLFEENTGIRDGKFSLNDSVFLTIGDELILWDLYLQSKIFKVHGTYLDYDAEKGLLLYNVNDSVRLFDCRSGMNNLVYSSTKKVVTVAKISHLGTVLLGLSEGSVNLYRYSLGGTLEFVAAEKLFKNPVGGMNFLNDSLAIADNSTIRGTEYDASSRILNVFHPGQSPALVLPGYSPDNPGPGDYFFTLTRFNTNIWKKSDLTKTGTIEGVKSFWLPNNLVLNDRNRKNVDEFGSAGARNLQAFAVYDVYGKKVKKWVVRDPTKYYFDMAAVGKKCMAYTITDGFPSTDSTFIFDGAADQPPMALQGKFAGFEAEKNLVVIINDDVKRENSFSIYALNKAPLLVRRFQSKSFDFPSQITRQGNILNIYTNSRRFISYKYDETIAKLYSGVTYSDEVIKDSNSSQLVRIRFDRKTNFSADSATFRFYNKFRGAVLLWPVRNSGSHYFINDQDTLTYFNTDSFTTRRLVIPHLFDLRLYDPSSGWIGVDTYQGTTLFYNVKSFNNKGQPALSIQRLPLETPVSFSGDFMIVRDINQNTVYDLASGISHKTPGFFTLFTCGNYAASYDETAKREYLHDLKDFGAKVPLPKGYTAKLMWLADGMKGVNTNYLLLYEDLSFVIWDQKNKKIKRRLYDYSKDTIYSGIEDAYLSSDERYLFTVHFDHSIRQWDFETGSVVQSYVGHTGGVTSLLWDAASSRLYSTSQDGSVKCWDPHGNCLATHYIIENDWLTVSVDGYYTCSKSATNYLTMSIGLESYEIEQFDPWLNRPDIILQKIGRANPALIHLFHEAYLKRSEGLKTAFFNPGERITLPVIDIVNKSSLPDTLSDGALKLMLHLADSSEMLSKVVIKINGQPIFGSMGLDLKSFHVKDTTFPVSLPLSEGGNKITLSVEDQKDLKSYTESVNVFYKQNKPAAANLYFIAIGVTTYVSPGLDTLAFALKDGEDLAALFSQQKGRGSIKEVYVTSYFNSNAVKQKIFECRAQLKKTNPEDEVIIFFSGHGLQGKDGNFYFATADVKLTAPEENGISLSDIKNLLDSVPARRKLVLIDACNTGSNNREVLITEKMPEGIGNLNQQELISLLQNSFVEFSNNSGNTIIGASAKEAIEYRGYHNGLFTSCVKDAFSKKEADLNGDGAISVNELSKYLFAQIYILSFGNQSPIVQSELADYDWPLFHLPK